MDLNLKLTEYNLTTTDISVLRSDGNHTIPIKHFGTLQTGIFGVWLVAIIIASVIGNLMVIIVIVRNKQMREAKNGTNLFLLHLAIADLMVGVCMAPVSLNTLIHEEWPFPEWFCSLNSFLNTLFLLSSIHLLMYMSIHKYMSVKRLSNANRIPLSRRTCIMMIAAAWAWGLVFGIITVSVLSQAVYRPKKLQCGPKYPRFNIRDATLFFLNLTLNIVTPILVMGVLYLKIFHILHQSTLFRRRTTVAVADPGRSERGAVRTLFLVIGIFIVCWFPYVVYIHFAMLIEDKNRIPSYLNPLAYCAGFTNSICNPIIYAFRFKDYRKGYIEIFSSSCRVARQDNMYLSSTKCMEPQRITSRHPSAASPAEVSFNSGPMESSNTGNSDVKSSGYNEALQWQSLSNEESVNDTDRNENN